MKTAVGQSSHVNMRSGITHVPTL